MQWPGRCPVRRCHPALCPMLFVPAPPGPDRRLPRPARPRARLRGPWRLVRARRCRHGGPGARPLRPGAAALLPAGTGGGETGPGRAACGREEAQKNHFLLAASLSCLQEMGGGGPVRSLGAHGERRAVAHPGSARQKGDLNRLEEVTCSWYSDP